MSKKSIIILLGILLIASVFRIWQLDSIPPGVYPDEAINANQAIEEPGKVFYQANNGREGLFINLLGLAFHLLGVSVWTLRIVPALIGILTVLGLYLLVKELFTLTDSPAGRRKAEAVAILSSLFLAASFWHTLFSRIAFRAILGPMVMVFGTYFLIKALRDKRLYNYILSGFFWGLGLYTYIACRIAPIILVIIVLIALTQYLKENGKSCLSLRIKNWWKKIYLKDSWWKVDVLLLTIILVALPLGIYFAQNPQDFLGRAGGVSIFNEGNFLVAAGESLVKHLGMFNFVGDMNWRHNYAGQPMLPVFFGALFIVGIILSIKEFAVSIKRKNWRLLTAHATLLSWFGAMLMPGVLTAEGVPHALRVLCVVPIVYIFIALAALWLWQIIKKIGRDRKFLSLFLCAVLILAIGFSIGGEFHKYFMDWGTRTEVKNAFEARYVAIGQYLNSLPAGTEKYLIVNELGTTQYGIGMSIPAQTVKFIEYTKSCSTDVQYISTDELRSVSPNKKTEILALYESGLTQRLKQLWPQGQLEEMGQFWVYKINSAQ